MTFINRLDDLIKSKKLTRKQFLEDMKFGKNQITYWEKNKTLPNPSTLSAIATFFGVSVEYLTGEETAVAYASRVMGLVVEWLNDNDYEYSEEENDTVVIGKDGDCTYYNRNDFINECMAIKKVSEDGFELAMLDWERRTFNNTVEDNSHHNIVDSKNVINDSPNATLITNETSLSKQEKELVDMYREFSLEEQLNLISYALKIKNKELK